MGLDMYLTGDRFHSTCFLNRLTGEYEHVEPTYADGFRVTREKLALGYWRKNAPLHMLMVNRFANGKDDCQPIDLDVAQLRLIATILRSKGLPTDEQCGGFFFGDEEWWAECRKNADEDAKVFEAAADWLAINSNSRFWNSVEYQASW